MKKRRRETKFTVNWVHGGQFTMTSDLKDAWWTSTGHGFLTFVFFLAVILAYLQPTFHGLVLVFNHSKEQPELSFLARDLHSRHDPNYLNVGLGLTSLQVKSGHRRIACQPRQWVNGAQRWERCSWSNFCRSSG